LLYGCLNLILEADIAQNRECFTPGFINLVCRGIDGSRQFRMWFRGLGGYCHIRAILCRAFSDSEADTAAGAANEEGFAL
jgi:chloramphenicol O-acetyltransferase